MKLESKSTNVVQEGGTCSLGTLWNQHGETSLSNSKDWSDNTEPELWFLQHHHYPLDNTDPIKSKSLTSDLEMAYADAYDNIESRLFQNVIEIIVFCMIKIYILMHTQVLQRKIQVLNIENDYESNAMRIHEYRVHTRKPSPQK